MYTNAIDDLYYDSFDTVYDSSYEQILIIEEQLFEEEVERFLECPEFDDTFDFSTEA